MPSELRVGNAHILTSSMNIIFIYAYDRSSKILMTRRKKSSIDWKAVGRRLRELRGFDINQKEFARYMAVSQAQLSRYEKGDSEINAEALLKISQKFGKSMEWLLIGKG